MLGKLSVGFRAWFFRTVLPHTSHDRPRADSCSPDQEDGTAATTLHTFLMSGVRLGQKRAVAETIAKPSLTVHIEVNTAHVVLHRISEMFQSRPTCASAHLRPLAAAIGRGFHVGARSNAIGCRPRSPTRPRPRCVRPLHAPRHSGRPIEVVNSSEVFFVYGHSDNYRV